MPSMGAVRCGMLGESPEGWDRLSIFLCDMLLKYIVRDRDRVGIYFPYLGALAKGMP
jgi:hypothetical protein